MSKRTAVIDIGSNSARLVIFQKTSRFGFHILCQFKSRVRIGEGAYHKGGHLQDLPMERAFKTLQAFSGVINEYRTNKILCVATSALRDAPNRSDFVERVKREIDLDIQVISGQDEARYGAIAASNLLPVQNAITIDIGGGSSDIAHIVNGKIVDTFSLNLGTVRLKELYTDTRLDIESAMDLIKKELMRLPGTFKCEIAVGIGGTARAIAKGIMELESYPLDKIHAFKYHFDNYKEYFDHIIRGRISDLDTLFIKTERHDTIREGILILNALLEHIGAKEVYSSGVGVREGVYLHDKLHKRGDRYPQKINPSIQSIRDRFDILDLPSGNKHQIAKDLFLIFEGKFSSAEHYRLILMQALSLSDIGKVLTIYKEHQHAFYIAMQELNFGFTHQEMTLIAMILRSKGKKYNKRLYRKYKQILPSKNTLRWLIFIYTLTLILHENSAKAQMQFSCKEKVLYVEGDTIPYLALEEISKLVAPKEIKILVNA